MDSLLLFAGKQLTENGLRNAFVLHGGGMLETAIDDGAQQFGFQQEIPEAGAVNRDVSAFDVLFDGGGVFLRIRGLRRLLLFVVVEEVVNGFGHDELSESVLRGNEDRGRIIPCT